MRKGYQELLEVFEAYCKSHPAKGTPASLYEPISYINDLGGKRIRPVLVMMAYNMWHDEVSSSLPAALAVEYFHNFTLMHDDIMDEAPIRRGKESVHEKFGRNAAILSGDAMLIRAFDLLMDAEEQKKSSSSLARILSRVALEICEGQQMDMDFEKMTDMQEEDYIEMIRKKTACLVGASMQIGSTLAGAGTQNNTAIYRCGENLGIAFQIQDDILDIYGDQLLTGKQVAGDILQGKKNFLYIRALNALPDPDKKKFIDLYSNARDENGIQSILEIYKALDIKQHALSTQQRFYDQAMQDLSLITGGDVSMLESFAMTLINRNN